MTRWIFEPGHTAAEFTARHMMVTHVRGHIKDVHGWVEFDPDDPTRGAVEARLDARKLWTGDADRDAHLKSQDFLHVEEHPEITFRGEVAEYLGCNELRVAGELAIRGIPRSVALDTRYLGQWSTPYWEAGVDRGPVRRIGFVGEALIDRHEFGVSWDSALDRGGSGGRKGGLDSAGRGGAGSRRDRGPGRVKPAVAFGRRRRPWIARIAFEIERSHRPIPPECPGEGG